MNWETILTNLIKNPPESWGTFWVNIIRMEILLSILPWFVWLRVGPCAILWLMDRVTSVQSMEIHERQCVTQSVAYAPLLKTCCSISTRIQSICKTTLTRSEEH